MACSALRGDCGRPCALRDRWSPNRSGPPSALGSASMPSEAPRCSRRSDEDAPSSFRDRKPPPELRCAIRDRCPTEFASRRHQGEREAPTLKSAQIERDKLEAGLSARASQRLPERIRYDTLEHLGRNLQANNCVVPARARWPNFVQTQEFFDCFDLREPLGRHFDSDRHPACQAWRSRLLGVRQIPFTRERAYFRLSESRVDEWGDDTPFHRREKPRPVLPQVIDVRSDEDHLVRVSRSGECLNGVVERALAVIAAIAGVRAISGELHLVGFDFLDARPDLTDNSMRIGALRSEEDTSE